MLEIGAQILVKILGPEAQVGRMVEIGLNENDGNWGSGLNGNSFQ